MLSWKITAKDLTTFCDSHPKRAQELLPELTKKLIEASVKVDKIHMPQGNSIDSHGFDGYLETQSEYKFVPKGKSYWELGTNKDISNKAKEDYKKRSGNSDSEITYIFGTFRTWEKKEDFCNQCRLENKWKDVLALNAIDYEAWLEEFLTISLWLAQKIEKLPPQNIKLIQTRLNEWKKQTKIHLNTELVLHGRNIEEANLKNMLEEKNGVIHIIIPSELEGFIFTLSVLEKNPNLLDRSLVVYSQDVWDQIIQCYEGLILLYENFKPNNIGFASQKHVVINISNSLESKEFANITLSHQTQRSFNQMGLSRQEAYDINKETYGYLDLIEIHPKLDPIDQNSLSKLLETLKQEPSNDYYSLFLAGAWKSSIQKDKEFLEVISKKTYEDLKAKIQKLHHLNFLETASEHHKILLKQVLINKLYQQHTLKNQDFLGAIKDMFIEQDKTFFQKKLFYETANFSYSDELRQEVADTLIILALKNQYQVDEAIEKIIDPNHIVESLFSLRKILALLAEASPKIILKWFEILLNKQDEHHKLKRFFEKSELLGMSDECGLFSALEIIAWDQNHFVKIIRLLVRLTKIDICKSKCLETLHRLFLGRDHNTSTSHTDRIKLLKGLYPKYPEIIWKILCKILSNHQANVMGYRPKYRDWCDGYPFGSGVKKADYEQYIEATCEVLSSHIDSLDKSQFYIFELLTNVAEKYQMIFIKKLKTFLLEADIQQRFNIKENLNLQINNVIKYNWNISKKCLKEMQNVVNGIEFDDPIYQNLHLFQKYFWDKEEANRVYSQRFKTIQTIYQDKNKAIILKLIELSNEKVCFEIGKILRQIDEENFMDIMLKWLTSRMPQEIRSAHGFFNQNIHKILNNKILMSNITRGQRITLLKIANIDQYFLEILENQNQDEQKEYWEQKRLYIPDDPKIIPCIFYKLLSFNMPEKALEFLPFYSLSQTFINDTTIKPKDIAQAMLLANPNTIQDIHCYPEIIKQLQKTDLELNVMACIEWKFFPFKDFTCKHLFKIMLQNPHSFIDFIFHDKNNLQEVDNKTRQAFEDQVRAFLNIFSFLDPESKQPLLNMNEIQNWIDQITSHKLETRHHQYLLFLIGKMLKRLIDNQNVTSLHEDTLMFLEKNLETSETQKGFVWEMVYPSIQEIGHQFIQKDEQEKIKTYKEYSKELDYQSYENLANCIDKIADLCEERVRRHDNLHKWRTLYY